MQSKYQIKKKKTLKSWNKCDITPEDFTFDDL